MSYLVFDTETTGVDIKGLPINHHDQPYIVQLAAVLFDDNWNVINELNYIIKPDNWSVPTGVAAIHGIPTDKAEMYGAPVGLVLRLFLEMWDKASHIVGQNVGFDIRRVKRYYPDVNKTPFDKEPKVIFDTMHALRDEMQLPLTEKQQALVQRATRDGWLDKLRMEKYKNPNLTEGYQYLFGEKFDNAHTATDDVKATARITKELLSDHREPNIMALRTMEECMEIS